MSFWSWSSGGRDLSKAQGAKAEPVWMCRFQAKGAELPSRGRH